MLCDFTETKLAKFNSGSLICKKVLEETGFAIYLGKILVLKVMKCYQEALQNLNDENLNDHFIQEYCPKIYKGVDFDIKTL